MDLEVGLRGMGLEEEEEEKKTWKGRRRNNGEFVSRKKGQRGKAGKDWKKVDTGTTYNVWKKVEMGKVSAEDRKGMVVGHMWKKRNLFEGEMGELMAKDKEYRDQFEKSCLKGKAAQDDDDDGDDGDKENIDISGVSITDSIGKVLEGVEKGNLFEKGHPMVMRGQVDERYLFESEMAELKAKCREKHRKRFEKWMAYCLKGKAAMKPMKGDEEEDTDTDTDEGKFIVQVLLNEDTGMVTVSIGSNAHAHEGQGHSILGAFSVSNRLGYSENDFKVLDGIKLEEMNRCFFPSFPSMDWQQQLASFKFDRALNYPRDIHYRINGAICLFERLKSSHRHTSNANNLIEGATVLSMLFPLQNDFLVRKNGLKVTREDLEGKYIMVCCLSFPVLSSFSVIWNASLLWSEFYAKLDNFEMVIMPRMRGGWFWKFESVNDLLSGFHPSCISVPVYEDDRRLNVVDYIDAKHPTVLLLAPDGEVVLNSPFELVFSIHSDDPLPFYDESWLRTYHTIPSSLETFLGFKSSDSVFRKRMISDGNYVQQEKPISELKSKVVGLYLCGIGNYLHMLSQAEEACRENDMELEIVIQFLPCTLREDPRAFLEAISIESAKRNFPWWVAPFNYFASARLKPLFKNEAIVILGPNGQYVDPRGAEIMQLFGHVDGYPFTRDSVAQKILEEVKKVSIKSIFESQDPFCKGQDLVGKNVLVYFDYSTNIHPWSDVCVPLDNSYDMLKAKDSDLVVVYVSLHPGESGFSFEPEAVAYRRSFVEKPWLICHDDPEYTDSVIKNFFKPFRFLVSTIVAFGKDGMISSLRAHVLLSKFGAEAFPFYSDLLEDISALLEKIFPEDYEY